MTAAFLLTELNNLIQESKRKHQDIKIAADRSLSELKNINVTSESQLASDLQRKPTFLEPFLLSCHSKNAKLGTIAVICLQRLTAAQALPNDRLQDVLDALKDTAASGLDVQLKILQTLPSLLQIYSVRIVDRSLGLVLEICADLQESKTAIVTSTATATFQQLITTLFERVTEEDVQPNEHDTINVGLERGEARLSLPAYDAYRVCYS